VAAGVGWAHTGILATAGHLPDTWGAEIALDLPNKSVMMPLVEAYSMAPGDTMSLPKMGARTVTARVRGAGNDEGEAVVFSALSDTAATFTKRAAYDGMAYDYLAINDLGPERLSASVNAHKDQAVRAMANDLDAQLLSLYSSASANVGGAGDFAASDLAEAIRLLQVANAPTPYYAVLPATQWDHLAADSSIVQSQIRGDAVIPTSAGLTDGFNYHGVRIFTTGNVPTASSVAHGLVFSSAGIRLIMRSAPTIKDWDDPDTMSLKTLIWQDFAYTNSFSDWIVDFQTVDN
jgi:hypothetical protein